MSTPAAAGDATTTSSSPATITATAAGLLAVIVVMLTAFALPSVHSTMRHIPIAVVGPADATAQLVGALDEADQGAFTATAVDSAQAARARILDRDAYGAVILGGPGLTVYTSSAASYTVSTAISQRLQAYGAQARVAVTIQDIRPLTRRDPKGQGLSAGALPISLGGWIAAIGIISRIVGTRQRLAAAAMFSTAAGFALTAVLFAIGTLADHYWTTSAAAVLGIAATCVFVLGIERLLRGVGIGIAAAVLVFLGNPLSGLASAPQMLPDPWGGLGQLLPPGATGTLLRNVSFFDGSAVARPILVLACWVGLGLGAYLAAGLRQPAADELLIPRLETGAPTPADAS